MKRPVLHPTVPELFRRLQDARQLEARIALFDLLLDRRGEMDPEELVWLGRERESLVERVAAVGRVHSAGMIWTVRVGRLHRSLPI